MGNDNDTLGMVGLPHSPNPADDTGGGAGSGARDSTSGNGQRSAAVVPLRTGGKIQGIMPTSIEECFRLGTAIAKSGMAPRDMATPEKLTVAIMYGLEIGIPPMMAVNKIAVVNGRPTLWGDAIPALLLSKGFRLREHFYGEGDERQAVCIVIRPDGEQITRTFSVMDAKIAGLWGKQGPWKQYPDRMLQMRARGLASRDGAADVLSGIYLAEEVQDIAEPQQTADLMPALPPQMAKRKSSAESKRDGTDQVLNEIRGLIADAKTMADLEQIKRDHDAALLHMPYSWAQLIEAEYQDKMQELEAKAE